MLINGMVRIIKINVKRITENGGSFLKRNSMLLNIPRCLFLVPLVIHELSIAFGLKARVFGLVGINRIGESLNGCRNPHARTPNLFMVALSD